MNTDQIAAQSAKEIWHPDYNGNSKTAQIVRTERIIKAAIKEATERLLVQREEMWKTIRELTSRAAQASEPVPELGQARSVEEAQEIIRKWWQSEPAQARSTTETYP